jgi:DNA-directed RNA polymerase subunit RPC12/RpoP
MLVKTVCPKCHRRIYFVKLSQGATARCPECGTVLTVQEAKEDRGETILDSLLEELPLTDVGSRERPFYLEEEQLLSLGKRVLDSVSKIEEWAKRSRQQLEREAQDLKRLIAYLEEKGRDPLLRKIEFLMLSSFIRNYYG